MAIDLDAGDWIPVFRKLRDSWIWKDAEALRAWMDILMTANRRESKIRFRGALLDVEPGQMATTYQALAKRWGWSRSRVQRFIAALTKDETIVLRRLEFVHEDPPPGEHQNVHVNGHQDAEKAGTTSGTWKDSDSDRSIAILTIVNSPVRSKWLSRRARENDVKRTPERAPEQTSREHVDEQETCHNPKGREGETTTAGQGETSTAAPNGGQDPPQPKAQDDEGGRPAVVVDEADDDGSRGWGLQGGPAASDSRDPLFEKVDGPRGAELLEGIGVEPSLAFSLAVQRPVGEVLDICVEARGKLKPAGFARRAIERGWTAPVCLGLEAEELLAKLRLDSENRTRRFHRLAGPSLLTGRRTERLPGESDAEFVARVQGTLQARKRGVQA